MAADLNYFVTNGFDQSTDCRDVFGLPFDDSYTKAEVKKKYSKLIRIYHPDKNANSPFLNRFECITKFLNKKLDQAYARLYIAEDDDENYNDNPPGEEVDYEYVHVNNALVLSKQPDMNNGGNSNGSPSSPNGEEDHNSQDSQHPFEVVGLTMHYSGVVESSPVCALSNPNYSR